MSIEFERKLEVFMQKAERRALDTLEGTVDRVHESIAHGSSLTGAPGQPIAEGEALDSWDKTTDRAQAEGHVFTTMDRGKALVIESGTREGRQITKESPVGGPHSIKLTIAAAGALVEDAAREVVGA